MSKPALDCDKLQHGMSATPRQLWPETGAKKVQEQALSTPDIRSTTPGSKLRWITGAFTGRRNLETTKARNKAGKTVVDFAAIIRE